MGSVSYLGLWPNALLDPASNFICPFAGGPPTESGGDSIAQPLAGASLEAGVNFIWKVKRWRITIDFTINIDWEFVFDDPETPTATGTLDVDRESSIVIDARNESIESILEESQIPCSFSNWYSDDDVVNLRPLVYDGGVGIEFGWINPSNDYSVSNVIGPESLDGSGGFFTFELPTSINFSPHFLSSSFMVTMTTNPEELDDLFSSLGAGLGQPTGATVSGTITISEEETWAY
jgi:hypothetical protein